jgi:hypothetical protein
MSAVDDALAKTAERTALTMRATVYVGNQWTTADKTGLKCSLNPLNAGISAIQAGGARTELASRGLLEWERSYTMPPNARVVVDAYGTQRWNVVTGTVWPDFGPGGGLIGYHGDVVKVS